MPNGELLTSFQKRVLKVFTDIDPARLKVNLVAPIDPKEMKNFFAAQAVKLLEKHRP